MKEELESTRNKLQQAQVALDSTREQINVLEKDNARRDDIDPVRADLNASRDELHAILKGTIKQSIEHPSYTFILVNNLDPTLMHPFSHMIGV